MMFIESFWPVKATGLSGRLSAILGTSSTSQLQNHSTTQLMLLSSSLTTGRPAVESGRLVEGALHVLSRNRQAGLEKECVLTSGAGLEQEKQGTAGNALFSFAKVTVLM